MPGNGRAAARRMLRLRKSKEKNIMAIRDKIERAIQNQPCTVKDLKSKFGGDRGADRKVMEAVDQLVHEAVICQRQGVFFTVRSGRAD